MSSNNNQQIIHDAKDTLPTSCDPTNLPTPSLTSKKGITPRNTSPKKSKCDNGTNLPSEIVMEGNSYINDMKLENNTYRISNESSKISVSKNALEQISSSCVCFQCVSEETSSLLEGAFDKILDVVRQSEMSNYHQEKIRTIRDNYLRRNKNRNLEKIRKRSELQFIENRIRNEKVTSMAC